MTQTPVTTIPARKVEPGVWDVLDLAASLGWPAVTGIPRGGRHAYLFRLANFHPAHYDPPDLARLRTDLEAIRQARTVSVRRFLAASGRGEITAARYNRAWSTATAAVAHHEDALAAAYTAALRRGRSR